MGPASLQTGESCAQVGAYGAVVSQAEDSPISTDEARGATPFSAPGGIAPLCPVLLAPKGVLRPQLTKKLTKGRTASGLARGQRLGDTEDMSQTDQVGGPVSPASGGPGPVSPAGSSHWAQVQAGMQSGQLAGSSAAMSASGSSPQLRRKSSILSWLTGGSKKEMASADSAEAQLANAQAAAVRDRHADQMLSGEPVCHPCMTGH